jgi:hypothetical protein
MILKHAFLFSSFYRHHVSRSINFPFKELETIFVNLINLRHLYDEKPYKQNQLMFYFYLPIHNAASSIHWISTPNAVVSRIIELPSIRKMLHLNLYFQLHLNLYFKLHLNLYFKLHLNLYLKLHLKLYFKLHLNLYFKLHLNLYLKLHLNLYLKLHLNLYLKLHLNLYFKLHLRFIFARKPFLRRPSE